MSIYDHYTGGEVIGMDHPLFMARAQSRIAATWASGDGLPLDQAMKSIPPQIRSLFGDVPGALISTTIFTTYAEAGLLEGENE